MKKKYKLYTLLLKLKKKKEKINQEYEENIKRLDLLLQQLDNALMLKNSENKNINEIKYNSIKSNEINNNTKNTNLNMGNFKSKRLSIINSMELVKIRTMKNNSIKNACDNNNNTKNNNNLNKVIENNNKISNDELLESKDEELIIKNNLIKEKNILYNKHNNDILNIKNEKKEIKDEINKIDEIIKKLSQKLIISKNNLKEHIQSLSDYYYQILKKGIDVRRNGLSWVIIKLMELNAFIDYKHFPNFLDIRQINYLMKIGAKIYEVKELIKLFQLFKKKEKLIKEGYYDEDRKKEKKEKKDKLNEIKKQNKNRIGNNFGEYLEEIQHKYDNAVNFNIDEERELKTINQTSKFLKDIILHDENDKNIELYFIPGSMAEYFSKDKNFRQYFDDIYYLNEEINKRQKEIKNDREKELQYYRNKFKKYYIGNNKFDENINNFIQIDKNKNQLNEDNDESFAITDESRQNICKMIFAALFGNGTPL